MMTLDASYRYCAEVARRRARNFYYSFLLLKPAERASMCAVYAFMRACDDLSDEPGATRAAMDAWRRALDNALLGRTDAHPSLPAFHDTVVRYRIPHEYFHDMIAGVSSDLEPRPIENFDELYRYCYQVASVVGLTVIHIFGFDDPAALALAEKCGVAFQLTNILRDVREDARNGRVYLPGQDLRRFGVDPAAFRDGQRSPEFLRLMRFEGERARRYYDESKPLLGLIHRPSRPSLWALIEIYSSLLRKIEASNYDVLDARVRLGTAEKLWVVARALARKAARK